MKGLAEIRARERASVRITLKLLSKLGAQVMKTRSGGGAFVRECVCIQIRKHLVKRRPSRFLLFKSGWVAPAFNIPIFPTRRRRPLSLEES